MDERLKQYLEDCKKKNLTWNQINHVLEGSNYPTETIEVAKTWYELGDVAPTTAKVKSTFIPNGKNKSIGIVISILIFIMILLGGVYFLIYFVSTQKLVLPMAGWQQSAERLAFTLPGIPINPKLLLTAVEKTQQKISKESFEINLTIAPKPTETETLWEIGSFEAKINGYYEASNANDPNFKLKLTLGNELEVEALKPDEMMYVKVNRIPKDVYTIAGLDPLVMRPLWDNWIGMDLTKANIQKTSEVPQISMTELLNNPVFSRIKLFEESHNNRRSYRLSYKPTPEEIIELNQTIWSTKNNVSPKSNGHIKSLDFDIWIDKNELLVTEVKINGITEVNNFANMTPKIPGESLDIGFAIEVKMKDYGVDSTIDKPDRFLTPEEFLNEFSKIEPGGIWGIMMKAGASRSAELRN